MKAHTVEKQEKDIILSIGMIVKNEEKVLERCLKSLQPLMKAIPCELIIADTGSTDSTVEIAKKYTDNVFHFEWINDFAAARNSTLEKAKGKWYFFLDADEYLDEDIHEIIEFFEIPELYNHYKCAQIPIRNYQDQDKKRYTSCMLPRFHRIVNNDSKVAFHGAIHETIYMRWPLGYFQTILHHTGYSFSSGTQLKNKQERNLSLMREEYKKTDPNKRSRILSLLIDGATSYPEEIEKYISESLTFIRSNRENEFSRGLFIQAINYYKHLKPLYALELCTDYYKTYPESSKYVATIAVILLKAQIHIFLGQHDQAYNEYLKYFSMYSDYKNEKLDISDCAYRTIIGLMDFEFFRYKISAINCLVELRKYEDAFKLIESFEFSKIKDSDFTTFISALQNICINNKRYGKLGECYNLVNQTKDDNRISIVINMLESTFYSFSLLKDRVDFAKQLVNTELNGEYIEIMKLYLSEDDDFFSEKLSEFINSIDVWKEGYSEIIYLSIKNKYDITGIVDIIPASVYGEKLNLIANTHDDFAGLVLEYGVPEQYTTNIKRFSWIVTMYEAAVYRCFELNDAQKYELYLRFTNLLGEYVSNIYNPELLQDENDIQVLPPLYKFGFYMLKANTALLNGDNIGYIRELKMALLNCEPMKEIVEFMLEQFKKRIGI